MNTFIKSHGLGNSYIIFDQSNINFDLTVKNVVKICSTDRGIGSDGILLKVPSRKADFGLKIYNPDGSEAEKSGNGIRIFGKFIYDYGFCNKDVFTVETLGGIVEINLFEKKNNKVSLLKAAMGKAIFDPRLIPVVLNGKEVLKYRINIFDESFEINCVSIGNPHCVIFQDQLEEAKIRRFGPLIENHPLFPSKINVQFVEILNRKEVNILIWERGAGYTQASGSSACAVVAIGKKLDILDTEVKLNMPGGELKVEIKDNWEVFLTGPVEEICDGKLTPGFFK